MENIFCEEEEEVILKYKSILPVKIITGPWQKGLVW